MKNGRSVSKPWLVLALAGWTTLGLWPSIARAQKFEINPLAEKKINELPAGPLYWQIENFQTLEQAQAAAGPTSLAAEAEGKVWLFTLGAEGGATQGGSMVAEFGRVAAIAAP
jgi:hypothetical protein